MGQELQRNKGKPLQITPRQGACILLVSRGYNSKQIAGFLGITPRTVNYHLFCLLDRFEARTLPHLVYLLANMNYFKKSFSAGTEEADL